MLAKPVGQLVLGQLACGESLDQDDQLGVRCSEEEAVEREKGFRDDRRGALVAVDERVVAGEAEGVGGGEGRGVRLLVQREVARAGHRAFERSGIADSLPSAMLGELLGVRSERHFGGHPDPARGHGLLGEFA